MGNFKISPNRIISLRFEILNFVFSLNDEGEGGGLNPTNRLYLPTAGFVSFDCDRPGTVNSNQPVRFRPAPRRIQQGLHLTGLTEVVESFPDRFFGHR